jgi:hypothetical protein
MSPSVGEPALSAQIDELRSRIETIERRLGIEAQPVTATAESPPVAPNASPATLLDSPGDYFPLIGKSLVGVALAYLLRAFTENALLPHAAGVGFGLLYALAWLVWAARTDASQTVTIGIRALTSALVLVPLLWEATLRFRALSSWTAASILAFFSIFGLAISWRKNLTSVAWVTSLAGLVACAVLALQSRDLLPYTVALIAMAAAVEASACLEHYLGERWIVALMADLAVLLMLAVATRSGTAETYVAINRWVLLALQILLLAIYLGSTFIRTLARARAITAFEIAQCIAAFLIATIGSLRLAGGDPVAVTVIGGICAAAGLSCYLVSFAFLARQADGNRNFYTYAAFGLALALASSWLLLKGVYLVTVWTALAIAFSNIGSQAGRTTLQFHATAYVLLAMVFSGAATSANHRYLLTTSHADHALPAAAIWIATAGAGVCYYLVTSRVQAVRSTIVFPMAASAFWGVAAIAGALSSFVCRATHDQPGVADLCATLLTLVLVALCLAAAYAAQRVRRRELVWIAIVLAVISAYKLVVQDLSHAPAFGVVLSLLAYGGALSLLPRFTRWKAVSG